MHLLRPLLFLLCCAGLMYGLFRDTPPPQVFNQSDKVGHIAGFAAMTAIAIWSLTRKQVMLFLIPLIALALGAEHLQQWLLPNRHYSIEDLYANLAGIAVILLPWLIWRSVQASICSNKLPEYQTSEKHQ